MGFFISLIFHKSLSIHRVSIIPAVIIWVVPILMLHRVVPYVRVWLFLLPLYIGLASSGIFYLLTRLIEPKFKHYKSFITAVLAVVLSIWLGLNDVQTRATSYSERKGTLRDPDYLTIFLKDYLKPGDRVLFTQWWWDFSFAYYFNLYDVPVEYLASDSNSAHRLLVLVSNQVGETVEDILDSHKLSITKYKVPRLLLQDKYGSLYEINKLIDGKEE
jgi:hypothetical protein